MELVMAYLDEVFSPQDIKKMTFVELDKLADEIRQAILLRNSLVGGHVASNLGIVETTLALHYVFNAPEDKIIFDVSHQSYAHKMITGRKEGFLDAREYKHISGFANPLESVYDAFYLGHTSTSISLASGLAKARDLNGENYNIIAVIGDGALSGGEAFEGLNFTGAEIHGQLLIVVNDNEMSIAENHGGLYENLRLLRETQGQAENNFFKALGFDYLYVEEGHNIEALVNAFMQIKDHNKPQIVHIHTLKGKGYTLAEQNKETWHKHQPFDIASGVTTIQKSYKNYNELTIEYLNQKISQGDNIAIITAGMPASFGFKPEIRQLWKERYIDVGIAEEHAIAMTSAMAKGGCRPIFCVGSTFIQRAYDQLSQDLALNQNPAVILVYGGGISSIDVTHLGVFDMAMMGNIPNLAYFSPAFYEEYISTLDWALTQNQHSVVIRVPQDAPLHANNYSLPAFATHQMIHQGQFVAIITDGHSYQRAEELSAKLKIRGVNPTLINAHYLSNVDKNLLQDLTLKHQIIITIEDGVLDGGFGEKVARFYGDKEMYVLCYGADKAFTNRVPLSELLQSYRLTPEQMIDDVMKLVSKIYGAHFHLLSEA